MNRKFCDKCEVHLKKKFYHLKMDTAILRDPNNSNFDYSTGSKLIEICIDCYDSQCSGIFE